MLARRVRTIKAIGAVAAVLGTFVRIIAWCSVRCLPLAGVGLIAWGTWLYDHRAAPIVGGILVLLILAPTDRRAK